MNKKITKTATPMRRKPTPAEVRAWARNAGWYVGDRGRIPQGVMAEYRKAMRNGGR